MIKALKHMLIYLLWSMVALILGIGHMRIVLGPNDASSEGLGYLFTIFYHWGLLHVGAVIGLVIALVFILFDIFYFRNKLKNNPRSIMIKFLALILITIFVGITHYLLERVIDVI